MQATVNGQHPRGLPFLYRLEKLAMRWGVPAYEIERQLGDPIVQRWVIRGMLFMRLEAVEVRRGH